MNYLSHFFFYREKDAYLNTGLILPDFSRSAKGRRKLRLEDVRAENALMQSLKRGCELHYEADDWFHDSAFFHSMTGFLEARFMEMENNGLLNGQKKWFMAHIFTEMMLDRFIIDLSPHSLDDFYSDLEATDLELVISFLEQCGKEDFDTFRKHYKIFCEVKYLYHYSSDKGLAESLDRMIRRTGQTGLSENAIGYISQVVPAWLEELAKINKPRQMARLNII